MKKISRLLACSVTLIMALSVSSYGWNGRGHMMVAAVAYDKLTAKTKKRVAALIGRNPDFDAFLEKIPDGTPEKTKQKMLFMLAATWPDMIKSDSEYHNDGENKGNTPPTDGTADRNTGYDDFARHKYWHFVDTPFPTAINPSMGIPVPNAKTRIVDFRKVLASDADDKRKSYDLCWLLHLVGDVHQPLHSATRLTNEDKDGDDGGNGVHLNGSAGNLHSLWDAGVGTSTVLATIISAASHLGSAPGAANELDVQRWIAESTALAQNTVYKSPIGPGTGPFDITPAYQAKVNRVSAQRVALAGARLAKILNEELR